ncbi:hypothetical protein ACFONN_17385 [Dyella humi]|uniref:Uncharacterized protein n=1 Tax=Dyella humi TaxID=1770547 RepID=A0ABW8IDC5_9GAMM
MDDISTSRWHPRFFDQLSLHHAYAAITELLLIQFAGRRRKPRLKRLNAPAFSGKVVYPGKRPRESSTVQYWWRSNLTAHHLNVLAEAILSIWTGTPLPRDAGPAERTRLIVRIIGWDLWEADSARNLVCTCSRSEHGNLYPAPHPYGLDALIGVFPEPLRDKLEKGLLNFHRSHGHGRPPLSDHQVAMYCVFDKPVRQNAAGADADFLQMLSTETGKSFGINRRHDL